MGSSFIDRLCEWTLAHAEEESRAITTEIFRDFPTYRPKPPAEVMASIGMEIRGVVGGLAARRMPGTRELDDSYRLGRRNAELGVAVVEITGAYHVGFRHLWETMLTQGRAMDPERAPELLNLVSLFWGWMITMTGKVVEGHTAVTRARQEGRIQLAHQFVTALLIGQADADGTAHLARALNFDPDGPYQVISCRTERAVTADDVGRRVPAGGGSLCVVPHGGRAIVVLQQVGAGPVADELAERLGTRRLGVGLVRPGLTGAAESLADAQLALDLATLRGDLVEFERDWLLATLLPHLERLAPLLDAGPIEDREHLDAAFQAYASSHFSIAESARSLHIHPNTMKYRLDRWQQISSWDPRTLDGLTRSLLRGLARSRPLS